MRPVNYTRIMKAREQSTLYLDGYTLEDAVAELERMIAMYSKDAMLNLRQEPYSYSDKEYLAVYTSEPETDEEMTKRIAIEEKYAKMDEDRDAADFKRLSEKFKVNNS